jgi:hypothetical protein|tara:strand:+ start:45 stop:665 length:621 start_codon:yes stop_codon:yes gene_type:complete
MTRIKQFANDMGLSYNKAKGLINKGRKLKDGGSTVLEKYVSIEIVPKRKTDRSRAKERMKQKNEQPKKKKSSKESIIKGLPVGKESIIKGLPVGAKNGKVTRINKDKSMQAKAGQFKNIVNASTSGGISPEDALKKIRKLVTSKKDGGALKELPPASENPGLRKLPTEVRNKMGFKKKGGTMKMSKGGVARGTGAAVKGTGFKGVY